jgi:hypothetical protein
LNNTCSAWQVAGSERTERWGQQAGPGFRAAPRAVARRAMINDLRISADGVIEEIQRLD